MLSVKEIVRVHMITIMLTLSAMCVPILFCIESINTPIVKNEEGFNIKKSKLILEGECPCQ